MDAIFTRRSIRTFLQKPVEKEKLLRILKAGMQAPSASKKQPWEFLVVTDQETKAALSTFSPYAGMAKQAGAVIVPMANHQRLTSQNPWWVEDLSACTQNMLLQIVEEGLGGVWIGMYPDEERVKALKTYLALPSHYTPFCLIALGYSDQQNRFVDRFDAKRIHWEKWGETEK